MEHYVGLDVSLKLTSICIVDGTGKVEREGVVASDPEAIATFIKLHAPHTVRIGLGIFPVPTRHRRKKTLPETLPKKIPV
jgi:predicted NBD/HSP70 family sugar kinase